MRRLDKYYEDLEYLFTGIEDGWINPSKEDVELYYAFKKRIRKEELDE